MIRNSGVKTLKYRFRSSKNWITVKPSQGDSKGEWDRIKVFLSTSGFSAGKHVGKIKVISGKAHNSPQKIKIVLLVKN